MSGYKLTYFDGRGRAEIIRLILVEAGVPFQDNRVSFDDFKNLKPTLPFGQLPVFEFDKKVLCQSFAIARFLARKHGLAGKTDFEQAQAEMVADCIDDTLRPIAVFARFEPDPVKKAELKKKYIEETLPAFLKHLEAILVSNKGGNGFFVGDALTWADLLLVAAQGRLELGAGLPTPFADYPKLNALFERIVALPRIAPYMAKLPVTPF